MSEIIIRQADASDRDQIVAMCKHSMKATYGSFMTEEAMAPLAEGDETDKYVDAMLPHMLVAEDAETVVGVVSLDNETIDLLWVDIERRGQGIGSRLLKQAEDQLATKGVRKGKLQCFEPNRSSIEFYQSQGWSITDTVHDDMAGVDKVNMVKELA